MVVLFLIQGTKNFFCVFYHRQKFLYNFRKKTAELRTTYVHDKAQIETNITSDGSGPALNGALVLGYQGWLAGYQYAYSTAKSALTKSNFALGYKAKDFTLNATL